jgi:hypothetical protein
MISKTKKGQDLVEYALTIPIFLVLLLIILDFGRITFYYASLTNAVREGARWGVIQSHHGNASQVEDRARSHAFGLDPDLIQFDEVTWYKPANTLLSTHFIQVRASYEFTPIIMEWLYGGQSFTLNSSSKMYLEY